jgi:hypothetical protein
MLNRKATAIVGVLLCASLMFVASPAISQSFYGLFVSVVRDAQGRFTRNAPFDRGVGQALSPAFSGFDQEQSDNNVQLALGDARSFTPTTINELNIGFVEFRRERRSVDAFTRNWIQELGIKGISPDPLTYLGGTLDDSSGYPEIGYSSNNAVFKWVTQSVQIVNNFVTVQGVVGVDSNDATT